MASATPGTSSCWKASLLKSKRAMLRRRLRPSQAHAVATDRFAKLAFAAIAL